MKLNRIIKFLTSRNNIVPIVILIIGVIIMLSVSWGGSTKKEVQTTFDTAGEETRLEEILSDIDGAGRVKVMITYTGSTEQNLAYEVKSDNDERSHQEDKRAVMSGNSPMVVQELYPEVRGVVITAQGAGNAAVKRQLAEAAAAATGVGISKVKVYKAMN